MAVDVREAGELAIKFDRRRRYTDASLPSINQEGIELGANEKNEAEVVAENKGYQCETCRRGQTSRS